MKARSISIQSFRRDCRAGGTGYNPATRTLRTSTQNNIEAMDTVETVVAQERELAELIVAALNLDIQAYEIEPVAPLYREGLGLDSIDILEIALAVSKKYGFQLRSDRKAHV